MRSALKPYLHLAAVVAVLLAPMLHGQTMMYSGQSGISLSAAAAPATGTAFSLQPSISNFTWQIVPTGTVSAATVNLEGSIDSTNGSNGHWFVIDQAAATDTQWSSGEMRHVINKGLLMVRCRLVSISGGGSITATIALFR